MSVQDSVVTLSGEVQSLTEMELAAKVAKSVRGVMALNNLIKLEIPEQRLDAELRNEIEQRFRWSVLIDDGLVVVLVQEGAVTLKVRPPSDLSDEVIAADIRGRLLVSPITESDEITVTVDSGKAILRGTVGSYLERILCRRGERLRGWGADREQSARGQVSRYPAEQAALLLHAFST